MSSRGRPGTPIATLSEAGVVSVILGRLDPLVHRGLTDALGEDRRFLLLELGNVEFERAVARQAPSVVVLGEAVEEALLARLKSRRPAPGILILASNPSRLCGTTLLAYGAACVAANLPIAEMLDAVCLVAYEEPMFVAADGERITPSHRAGMRGLTRRERQVLERLSRRKSNAEIALELRINIETVRTHAANLRRKLNVPNNQALVGIQLPHWTNQRGD